MRIVSRVISPSLSSRFALFTSPFNLCNGRFMNFRLQTLDSIHASNKLHLGLGVGATPEISKTSHSVVFQAFLMTSLNAILA
jgi:outer membrane scaffolding protein for murein synthesis (MipA/OmpV family)